jgi:hypothetical protein
MNAKLLVSAGAIALATVGCGYSIKTATDYNRSVNFSNYHSYSFVPGSSSGNPLMDERAAADVKNTLASKGWREVPADKAQATVIVHAATKTKHTYQTFYDGFGGGWRRWGYGGYGGNATTYVQNYKVGTLVVDIFDATTKEAIWHGFASDALSNNASSNAAATAQAIDKMFTTFPPPAVAASGQ